MINWFWILFIQRKERSVKALPKRAEPVVTQDFNF